MPRFYDGPKDQWRSILTDGIPRGTLCLECKKHLATEIFTHGDIFSVSHGDYEVLCECCLFRRQLDHAEEMATKVVELREKLETACKELNENK